MLIFDAGVWSGHALDILQRLDFEKGTVVSFITAHPTRKKEAREQETGEVLELHTELWQRLNSAKLSAPDQTEVDLYSDNLAL